MERLDVGPEKSDLELLDSAGTSETPKAEANKNERDSPALDAFSLEEEEKKATPKKPETEEKPEEEEVKAKGEEDEEEVEDEDFEVDPTRPRPTFKQLNDAFPELFKKFPELRHALGRERDYSRIFPTIDDAVEAVNQLVGVQKLESDIMQGNPSSLIQALESQSPEAAELFADAIIPAIASVSPKLYQRAMTPFMYKILKGLIANGNEKGDKNLVAAAKIIGKHIFDDPQLEKMPSFKRESEDPEKQRFEEERRGYEMQRFTSFKQSLQDVTYPKVQRMIARGLEKLEISDYTRDALIQDIIEETTERMASDPEHMHRMDAMIARAAKSGYTEESKAQIISAYLGRFQSLMPAIKAKKVEKAIGRKELPPEKKQIPSGGSGRSDKKVVTVQEARSKKMTDMDILNSV